MQNRTSPLERPPKRNQSPFRAIVAAGSLLLAGCGSADHSPHPTTTITAEKGAPQLAHAATVTGYPEIASLGLYKQEHADLAGQKIELLYAAPGLKSYQAQVTKAIQAIAMLNEQLTPAKLTIPDHTSTNNNSVFEFTPKPNTIASHTYVFGPEQLAHTPPPFQPKDHPFVDFTITTPDNTETTSILTYQPAPFSTRSLYSTATTTFDKSLFTEVCQSQMTVTANAGPNEPQQALLDHIGQERYCNSVGSALAAAQGRVAYGEYRLHIQNITFSINGLNVPALPAYSEPTYNQLTQMIS